MVPSQKPTTKPRSGIQKSLVRAGVASWTLLLAIIVFLYVSHRSGLINAWQFPLKPVGAFLGGGGLACFAIACLLRISKKQVIQAVVVSIIAINAIAYLGAYSLTHLRSPEQFGLGIVRAQSTRLPSDAGLEYIEHRISISQTEWLDSWLIPTKSSSNGTVILFPGNGGSKANQLIAPAQVFAALNYDSLLVDFRGVGGSSGNVTTLGMREADDVEAAVHYAEQLELKHPIVLYGVSMGSAGILKAIAQEQVAPDAIILELPFTRLVDAVKIRLKAANIPSFPTAELLVLWGGLQHGMNGFAHNPVNYAKQVSCPTLVLQGDQDRWITMAEIDQLLQNLQGPKQLAVFESAGHQLLVTVNKQYWQESVDRFLKGMGRSPST